MEARPDVVTPLFVRDYADMERSDRLAEVRHFHASFPGDPPVFESVACVIDANRVLRTASAKARYRDPAARTPLEEVADSDALRLFAPPRLREEVAANLDDFAGGVDRERLEQAAASILRRVTIVAPPEELTSPDIEALRARHAKDVPYAQLYEHINADVLLTGDRDFEETSYRRIGMHEKDSVVALRDYCRAVVVERTRKTTVATTLALGRGLGGELVRLFRLLPGWAQFGLGMASVIGLLHPRSRPVVGRAFEVFVEKILPPLTRWNEGMFKAQFKAEAARKVLLAQIPRRPRPLPLRDLVFQVCSRASDAMTIDEIAAALARSGRRSSAPSHRAYLKRVLRQDPRIMVLPDGRFGVRAVRVDGALQPYSNKQSNGVPAGE